MSDLWKIISIVCIIIIVLIGLSMLIDYVLGLQWYSFIAPKKENVRREVFENTKSYNEGKKQDLIKYRLEYLRAEDKDKSAIASTIRLMFADYDLDYLQPELQDFLKRILYGGEN